MTGFVGLGLAGMHLYIAYHGLFGQHCCFLNELAS